MYSLVQSVMRQLVVLVPAAWLLSKISLGAVWFCFPISELISLIVTVVFFVILYNKEIKNLDKPVNSAAATESVKGSGPSSAVDCRITSPEASSEPASRK